MSAFILAGWTLVGLVLTISIYLAGTARPTLVFPCRRVPPNPSVTAETPPKQLSWQVAFMGIDIPSKQILPCHTWWVVPVRTGTPPNQLLPRVVGEPAPLSNMPQLLHWRLALQAIMCAAAIAGPLSQLCLLTKAPITVLAGHCRQPG